MAISVENLSALAIAFVGVFVAANLRQWFIKRGFDRVLVWIDERVSGACNWARTQPWFGHWITTFSATVVGTFFGIGVLIVALWSLGYLKFPA